MRSFHLRLFGTPSLVDADDHPLMGRVTQRHRLALLALLALAPKGGLSREKALAYLWPERDASNARNLLNQAVHFIRKAMGEDALTVQGDILRLDPVIVSTDVGEFERSIRLNDLPTAAAAYAGPLLDGFFLRDALEFERWLDHERERLAAAYAKTLESLADRAEQQGDFSGAIGWWKARSDVDPLDSRVASRLIEALAASGNPAGAMRHADRHLELLERELGLSRVPEIEHLVERLRTAPPAMRPDRVPGKREKVASVPPGLPTPRSEAIAAGSNARPTPRKLPVLGIAALVAGIALVGLVLRGDFNTSRDLNSVAILPFTGANPADAALAAGMTEDLNSRLAAHGIVRAAAGNAAPASPPGGIDSVDRGQDSPDVTHYLDGTLERIGSRLRVTARLRNKDDVEWSETYERGLDDLFVIQDEIVRAIMGELGLSAAAGGGALGRFPTHSVAAYELYQQGMDPVLLRSDSGAIRRVDLFQRAVQLDSTYAAAYAQLAMSYLRLRSVAAERSNFAQLQNLAEEAIHRSLSLDDSAALTHMIYGRVRQVSGDYATAEAQYRRAIALDPSDTSAYDALVELYIETGRARQALVEAEKAILLTPLNPSINIVLARALMVNGRCEDALTRLNVVSNLQPPPLRIAPAAAQCYAMLGRWPDAVATIRQQAETQPDARALLGYLLARAGQVEESMSIRAAFLEQWERDGEGAVYLAMIDAGLDDRDSVFAWLDAAIADRSIMPHWGFSLILEPIFQDLHSDPRFERVRLALGVR